MAKAIAQEVSKTLTRLTFNALDQSIAWIDRMQLGFRRFFGP